MDAPDTIHKLVERFNRNLDDYRSGRYKEAQLRSEFINPFFIALGWDVNNEQGWAEAYKEVIHEYSQKIGDSPKAPDYCFRIGGQNKFFVEAKKPVVDIKSDINPAFQLRRYAWSAKLPLSILTDFEEFAVYDCRVKPSKDDKASKARITYFRYADYIEKWDDICSVFSPVEIRKGSFDRYADTTKKKRGTAEVDDAFLEDIEAWRDVLAKHIILRNPKLSVHQLNRAVQVTIDRIIFLRICEDRGIEPYGQLRDILGDGGVYPKLVDLFRNADDRYNSGLFHFQKERDRPEPDNLTPKLKVDDKILRDILGRLYYPDSPYEFSVLPADILGQVYERFLGKVIRLTPGGRAKVEEKPEVRKAGGVYYTPTYIVDYIVEHTVGKLLEKKTPKKVENLRILDPACGSGSFLIGAYQYLLNWHIDYYGKHKPVELARKRKPPIYKTDAGDWKLTTAERKRILLNNIYGVDIDTQAVEVTKLSLLLKVLEDESKASLDNQLHLLHERALPDLSNNIKCGNSLIGTDYYDNTQMSLLDDEESRRINVFDWETEFRDIFKGKNPGFAAVIGNPPYVRQETLGEQKDYFKDNYKTYHGIADLYTYFIERGISLLRNEGFFGYIVANKWMRANYGEPLRKWLKTKRIAAIIDFGDLRVFEKATTYPCILLVRNNSPEPEFKAVKMETLEFGNLNDYVDQNHFDVEQAELLDSGWELASKKKLKLLCKLRSTGSPLGEYTKDKIYRGILTGLNEAFVIDNQTRKQLIAEDSGSKELIKPFLAGRDIKRYQTPIVERFLISIPKGWTTDKSNSSRNAWKWFSKNYPAIANHLKPFETAAVKRCDKGDHWWELRACDYYDEFERPKLIYPNICKRPEFTFDDVGQYTNQKCFIIPKNDKYLLAIMNSKVINFLFAMILPKLRGGFYEPGYVYMKDFPIREIDMSNADEKKKHDKTVQLVERMLKLNKQLHAKGKTQHEKTVIQRQIAATDKAIDKLVYELYGLTEDEIKIVEGVLQ